ncbi:MAG: hypothetical protein C7B45_17740 [Sulfobacillus acidophilus]|uniref:Uncharacterized protein n=1 Tax=Sulfobacillus acidophilus TaxID=53633 RepID=A0A2T2WC86_9FIRM|nr:MAG: hypothetical protein C7B45_17740 [Sulfobacillus acidophilus]
MNRWRQWLAPRQHPGGLSSGVGMMGGLVLLVTVLTAGIGATQLARVHAALAQAAQAAVQSEQQQGCWTQGTTQAVYQTLKGAGINPNTVRLTADTASSTTYGGAVTAGLATTVGVSVLGAKLMEIPIAAGANATSFYTPATAGGSNAACITPATCPTTVVDHQQCTPAHQVCQNVTTQDCTPVSEQVCGPVTQTQCGYTTEDEYTCTPVQSCHQETTVSNACDWFSEGSVPSNVSCRSSYSSDGYTAFYCCYRTTENVCTTQDDCGYHPVSVYSCHDVTTTECRTETTQSCHPVTSEQCSTVPAQCTTTPETINECG